MRLLITAESHNEVSWEVQTSTVWIEVGLLVGWAVCVAVIALMPSADRWAVIAGLSVIILGIALTLALTAPLAEYGHLIRLPDSGDMYRAQRWLLRGERVAWETPLEPVTGFFMETRAFEETGDQVYTQARLWAVLDDAPPARLTLWGDPQAVESLGLSLAKAGRRTFDRGAAPPVFQAALPAMGDDGETEPAPA